MAYIGKTPTAVPLTSSDIAADIINNTHIGDTAISGFDALATAPADTDEFLISDAGTLKRIDASLVGGGGITMADSWRVTSAFSGNANPLSSNWERNDTAPSLSYFGSQMTESSGVFAFPSTGIYLIHLGVQFKLDGSSSYCSAYIQATTNNSSYINIVECNTFVSAYITGDVYNSTFGSGLVDITDTSNQKIRFRIDLQNTGTEMSANSVRDTLYARFIRLGDT